MKVIKSSNVRAMQRLLNRAQAVDSVIEGQVARIVNRVRRRGDRALQEYAKRFDKVIGPLEISRREM